MVVEEQLDEDAGPTDYLCCGNMDLFDNKRKGEATCRNCGMIHSEYAIDPGPEWRAFDAEQQKSRVRAGVRDKYMSTLMINPRLDSKGRGLPSDVRKRFSWLGKLDRNIYQRTTMLTGRRIISNVCGQNHLPPAIETESLELFERYMKEYTLIGHSIESVSAAVVHRSCKLHKDPADPERIAQIAGCDPRELRLTYKALMQRYPAKPAIFSPDDHLSRITSELSLSNAVDQKARDLVSIAKKAGLSNGRDPKGIAAAAVYGATLLEREYRGQTNIADAARVTGVTLRTRYKELRESAEANGVLLPHTTQGRKPKEHAPRPPGPPRTKTVKPDPYASMMNDLCGKLDLPLELVDEGRGLVRALGPIHGTPKGATAAAALYLVCQLQTYDRPLETVAEASGYTAAKLDRIYARLVQANQISVPAKDARDYLPNLVSGLGTSNPVAERADSLLCLAAERGLIMSGKDPKGLAGAALYLASQLGEGEEMLKQETIARAAAITPDTLRNRYYELLARTSPQ